MAIRCPLLVSESPSQFCIGMAYSGNGKDIGVSMSHLHLFIRLTRSRSLNGGFKLFRTTFQSWGFHGFGHRGDESLYRWSAMGTITSQRL